MKKTHTVKLYRSETGWFNYSWYTISPKDFLHLTGLRLRKGQTVKLKFTHLKNGFKAEVVK